jgi:voltage-gated potassium channel
VTDRRVLNVQMEELPVGEESPWAGTSIRDAGTRAVHRLLIVALRRADGTMVFNPDADLVVRPGDTAIVMGKREDIEKFRQEQRL